MEFPSKLIEQAVNEISRLPGIGKKTALRLALHLLKEPKEITHALSASLINLRDNITYCESCHSIADDICCSICGNALRESQLICVVEDSKDVIAIENTQQYRGKYHVLNGKISPIEGIGPEELNITSLIERVQTDSVKEIIFALSPTMEGDTTAFYITKQLRDNEIKLTTIARGIPLGSEIEYADEITLGRSIQTRVVYGQDSSTRN